MKTFDEFLKLNPYPLTSSFTKEEWEDSMFETWKELTIKKHKRMLWNYNRFKDLQGRYNSGRIEGDVFTLTRIKDGQKITSFNINTFLPE